MIGRKLNKNLLLLDGAMGTELLQRGVNVSLPLWSASAVEEAPEIVEQIHRDYMKAGADIIITNTFRTTTRTFLKTGASPDEARARAKTSTNEAVRLAKKAASGNVMVAGSMAPLEDCYSPELFPGMETAIKEFEEQGAWLLENGVDLLLLETMIRQDETIAALRAVSNLGIPVWVSFCIKDKSHLFGGDDLKKSVKCIKYGVDAILINCSNIQLSINALIHLKQNTDLLLGIYPNTGLSMPSPEGEIKDVIEIEEFTEKMMGAVKVGVSILGSCCGSTPDYTKSLRKLINELEE